MGYFEDNVNKIIHDDCLNVLRKLPDRCIDLVVTDPPYEQEFHGGKKPGFATSYSVVKNNTDFMNYGYDYENILPELIRVCKIPNMIIFCSNSQIAKTMAFFEDRGLKPTLLIWRKTNAAPLGNGKYISDIEYVVYVRGKGATFNNVDVSKKYKVKSFPFVSNKHHPAQKPIELICEYIETHSNEGDVVLDIFSGSGTTALASYKLKRNYICVEKDEEYYKLSCDLVKREKSRKKLF